MKENDFYILTEDHKGCFTKGSYVYLLNRHGEFAQVAHVNKDGHIVNWTELVHIDHLLHWDSPAAKVLYAEV